MKFKVGDTVIYCKGGKIEDEGEPWGEKDGLKVGGRYTILEVTAAGNIRVRKSRLGFVIHPDHFKKVGPAGMKHK